MRIFFCLFALLLPATAVAQLPPDISAAANRIDRTQVQRDLDYLASDALLGRATFTPGFDSAAAYIAARLKRAGLQPFGDNGTYFQSYYVRSTTADTSALYLEIGGRRFRHGDILVNPGEVMPVSVTAPVVYVGHGMRSPSRGVDPYAGIDVRGKFVLMHMGVLPRGIRRDSLPEDVEFPFRAASARGAIGILYLPPPRLLQLWGRIRAQAGTFEDLVPNVRSAYSSAGRAADILLQPQVTELLLAGEPGFIPDTVNYAPSFQLRTPVTLHVPIADSVSRRGYNVLAKLEGSHPQQRNQYVTVAAHLDGAVSPIPVAGDSIYNAADDNASGSAGTLAIAEQLARAPRARRSIVFIWDSGEEIGLFGTRSFVGKPVVPLDRIVTHFNVDMIGVTRAPGSPDSASTDAAGGNEVYVSGPRVLSASFDSLIEQTNRALLNMHLNRKFDRADHEFFYPRTDAGPFLERGVLAVGFFTGLHPRYHRPSDEARFLDAGKIAAVSKTLLGVIWAVANAESPPRIDKPMPTNVPRY